MIFVSDLFRLWAVARMVEPSWAAAQLVNYKSKFLHRNSEKRTTINIQISRKHQYPDLAKPSFRILTKIQLRNLNQTSVANFRILTKPCDQSLNKSLALCPNLSFQICNKLLPTRSSSSTSATATTSTSFELASSHARVTSIKFTKRQLVSEWVSQSVSEWQAFPMIGLESDKNSFGAFFHQKKYHQRWR